MDWMERLNQAIDYIEDNLEGAVDYAAAAKIACCSAFQFQRMFSYIAGVTLSEYIRRRRMTKAAFDLQSGGVRILDLAVKYGYDSPTSFSRAFQTVHQLSPSAARRKGVPLKTYPKLVFRMTVTGDAAIQYRIEPKPAVRIVGIKKKFGLDLEKNFVMIPGFWAESAQSELFPKLEELMNQSPLGILGVTAYQNQRDCFHYIAVATDKPVPGGMTACEIPAATWAIFECAAPFPDSIQNLYRRFYTEWLPFSGYQYAETYDIEVYPAGGRQAQPVEVWFLIKNPQQ